MLCQFLESCSTDHMVDSIELISGEGDGESWRFALNLIAFCPPLTSMGHIHRESLQVAHLPAISEQCHTFIMKYSQAGF